MKPHNLKYWRKNAEEDYLNTPISVLRYIGELESRVGKNKIERFLNNILCQKN